MAEKKELTVEERLAKATECYKEVKAKLDAANARIAELEAKSQESGNEDVAKLLRKVKELEDEITINGNSQEEIAKLNERLNKAKAIFAEQKTTISEQQAKVAELNMLIDEKNKMLSENQETILRLENEKEISKKTFESLKAQLTEIASTL